MAFVLFAIAGTLFAETILNPSGIMVGNTASYWVSIQPTNFPDNQIVWTAVPPNRVSFPQGRTGRTITVRGETVGDVVLKPVVSNYPEFTPALKACVVSQSTVTVDAYIICPSTGQPPFSSSSLPTIFSDINDIWRQAGISFQLGNTTFVTNDAWLSLAYVNNDWPVGNSIVNFAQGTGHLECYCIGNLEEANAFWTEDGIILGTNSLSPGKTLAHELGHACGLDDIYDEVEIGNIQITITNAVSSATLQQEFGSTTTNGYYATNTMQADVIRRVLMCGTDYESAVDIPYDDITGLWYSSWWDSTNGVWQKNWDLSPAPVGFFIHGNPHPVSQ